MRSLEGSNQDGVFLQFDCDAAGPHPKQFYTFRLKDGVSMDTKTLPGCCQLVKGDQTVRLEDGVEANLIEAIDIDTAGFDDVSMIRENFTDQTQGRKYKPLLDLVGVDEYRIEFLMCSIGHVWVTADGRAQFQLTSYENPLVWP